MSSGENRIHFGRYSPIPDSKVSKVIFTIHNLFKKNDGSLDPSWDDMVVHICNELNISREDCLEYLQKELEMDKRYNHDDQKFSDLDCFSLALIRRHVHDYYLRGEHPSRNDILDSLRSDNLFSGSILEWRHIVKKLGFSYQNIRGKMLLWERNKIVNERCIFLEALHDENLENIVWIGETFINLKSSAVNKEVINEWKVIVLHAGTIEGFVDYVTLVHVFEDVNKELDCTMFNDWFEEQLMPCLDAETVIVMENSAPHRDEFDKPPTDEVEVTEEDIKSWFRRHMIEFDETLTKTELIALVKVYKSLVPRYTVDYTAKLFGNQVLRYPAYHNHFNPFHLISKQIQNNIEQYKEPESIEQAEHLVHESLSSITPEDWSNAFDEIYKILEEAWNYEALLEMAKDKIKDKLLLECNASVDDCTEDCESVSEISDESTQYSYDTDINGEKSSESSDSAL